MADLRDHLRAARGRTLAATAGLRGERLLGPRLEVVNPPLWELGHIAWFQERWCLRELATGAGRASRLPGADACYDSARVPHAARWSLALPDLNATHAYLAAVLRDVLLRLSDPDAPSALRYFARLAAHHEEMHAEAFDYTRQTLGYEAAHGSARAAAAGPWPGDAAVAGGTYAPGAAAADPGFVFDNEQWAHPVAIAPFRMALAPVTNAEYAIFVAAGGYREPRFWCAPGWRWRTAAGAAHPAYWRQDAHGWSERSYAAWQPLAPHQPMVHVNWYEASAYCRWAQRRLPTEAEWEFAAATVPGAPGARRLWPWGDAAPDPTRAHLYGGTSGRVDVAACADGDSAWGVRQMLGNVWEWTADDFRPYPGFEPGPYREYSLPWFGTHKVLRGGCHMTSARLATTRFRNFYTPERHDVYAGFRTCAL